MSQTIRALLRHLSGAIDPEGTDADLLDRFAGRRDAAAFAALVARHGPMVLGVCQRLLRDSHDTEDAFQATFLVLARKATSLGRGDPVGAWLHGVACRVAAHARVNRSRRRDRERRATAMAAVEPTPAVLWEDLRPILDEEVCRLPDKYRVPVVLCYLGGKTYDEAALEIGCPKGTVATRLTRARELLRGRLSGRGVALAAGGLTAILAGHGRASVPASLLTATAGAATSAAASPAVAALTEGVLKAMSGSKLKVVTALLVTAGVLAAAAGALAYRGAGSGPDAERPAGGGEPAREPPAAAPPPQPVGWIRVAVGDKAFLFRPDGTGRAETPVPTPARLPSLDGKSVAEVRTSEKGSEVIVTGADGKDPRRVSPEGVRADGPCWSPDGRRVAFLAEHNGVMQVHVADREGRDLRRLTDGPFGARAPKFGPDGRLAYLLLGKPEFKRQPADLVVTEPGPRAYSKGEDPAKPPPDVRPGPTGTMVRDVLITEYAWSPDGEVIAYGKPAAVVFHEARTGKAHEVPFAALDAKLANHAAVEVAWSPDGRAVACRLMFWGGRQANGPKMLGDEEVFVFPREGQAAWFAAGGEVRRVEWLKDRPPAAVDIRMPDGSRPVR